MKKFVNTVELKILWEQGNNDCDGASEKNPTDIQILFRSKKNATLGYSQNHPYRLFNFC